MNKPSWFTFETVIESIRQFLKECPLPRDKKYYMVMDNAPWHQKAKKIIKENAGHKYDDINKKVVFVYLPPYSPDLNPIEQVWRKVRRDVTHNRFFPNAAILEEKLDEYYDYLSIPNMMLQTLCTFKFHVQPEGTV